jgi:hypothetical protein
MQSQILMIVAETEGCAECSLEITQALNLKGKVQVAAFEYCTVRPYPVVSFSFHFHCRWLICS